MATFPEDPVPDYPGKITPNWKTVISTGDSGVEQRRQKWVYAKYDILYKYEGMIESEMQIFWDFYQARKGAFESFYTYFPPPGAGAAAAMNFDALYVGIGDGSTEIFDIPGKSTSAQSIYVDGVLQTVTTDYVILTGGGTSESDRVDFVSAPANGEIITCDFTGFLRVPTRFAKDNMDYETFINVLWRFGLELKGLAFAE